MAFATIEKHRGVGCVLWLKRNIDPADCARYNLKVKACNHPCIVVDMEPWFQPAKFFTICVITSFSNVPTAELRSRIGGRRDLIPILPNSHCAAPGDHYLELEAGLRLRRESWANFAQTYTVPSEFVERYDKQHLADHFKLTPSSVDKLRRCCGLSPIYAVHGLVAANTKAIVAPMRTGSDEEPRPKDVPTKTMVPPMELPPSGRFASTQSTHRAVAMAAGRSQPGATRIENAPIANETTALLDSNVQAYLNDLDGIMAKNAGANLSPHLQSGNQGSRINEYRTPRIPDEEAWSIIDGNQHTRSSFLRQTLQTIWQHLPSRREVRQVVMLFIGLCMLAGILGGLGYGAYLIISKLVVLIKAVGHGAGQAYSGTATVFAAVGRGIAYACSGVIAAFETVVNGMAKVGHGLVESVGKLVAPLKALLGPA